MAETTATVDGLLRCDKALARVRALLERAEDALAASDLDVTAETLATASALLRDVQSELRQVREYVTDEAGQLSERAEAALARIRGSVASLSRKLDAAPHLHALEDRGDG